MPTKTSSPKAKSATAKPKKAGAAKKGQNKTTFTKASVADFIDAVPNETRRKDAKTLLALFKRITGEPAVMWGPSIVGFGTKHYKYESGREGDVPLIAFSPRGANLVLYLHREFDGGEALMKRLGKYKLSMACLYVNKLADLDMAVLEELLTRSYAHAPSVVMRDTRERKR